MNPSPKKLESAWRNPYVWLVLSFPILSVFTGVTLLVFAVQGADVPIIKDRGEQTTTPANGAAAAMQPALKGRNRAAEIAVKP